MNWASSATTRWNLTCARIPLSQNVEYLSSHCRTLLSLTHDLQATGLPRESQRPRGYENRDKESDKKLR